MLMATPDTSTWRMADALAGGTLADQILTLRANGTSWRRMSTMLLAQHIDITEITLAEWHRQLVDEQEQAS